MMGAVSASVAQQPREKVTITPGGELGVVKPGLMLTKGARGVLYHDEFERLGYDAASNKSDLLGNDSNAVPGPGVWSRIGGQFGGQVAAGGAVGPLALSGLGGVAANGATGLFTIGSGAMHSDALIEGQVSLRNPVGFASTIASGASIELYPKQVTTTQGVAVRLVYGPSANHHIAIIDYTSSGATARASAALGASTASGFAAGQSYRLAVAALGGEVRAWLATGSPDTPIISASHGNFTQAGWPAVKMQNGAASDVGGVYSGQWLDSIKVTELGASAPDIGAREWFRFESHPEPRAFQGNASIFQHDRAADFRGQHPRIPPVGSPGASGPARIVVLSGDPDDFLGNDTLDVNVTVREKYRYLR